MVMNNSLFYGIDHTHGKSRPYKDFSYSNSDKTIFGGELDARTLKNQTTEVKLKCMVLNKFIGTGMPDAYKV